MNTTNANPQTPSKPSTLKRWLSRLPAILILAFISFRFLQLHRFNAPKQIQTSNLHLKNLDGSMINPSEFAGKAVVLNYWAPWCPPCRVETPWLQHLQELHPNDLVVVGVVADSEQYRQAATFMSSRGITYPLARETASLDQIVGTVAGLPTTFYISPSGKVVHTTSGLTPELLMKRYANDAVKN
jgi:cytochrome c biogenesis protein CcmG/thiol:disulfide interchange protein DsbE